MVFEYQLHLAIAAFVGVLAYGIYRLIIPTPIPGIPYPKSFTGPFGNIPEALKWNEETQTISKYFTHQARELQSSIYQVALSPFGKPWVVISDPLAIEDMLVHRTVEFDLSPLFSGLFAAIIPNAMTNFSTHDPRWKLSRRLLGDTMSNNFLHGVASHHILKSVQCTVDLWQQKSSLGGERPIDAAKDVADMMMESTWASAFGENLGMTQSKIQALSGAGIITSITNKDELATFPQPPSSQTYESIYALADSTAIVVKSPLKGIAHAAALMFNPTLRRANQYRKKYIGDRLEDAWARFSSGSTEVKSAADLLVEKEVFLASKENRPAKYDSPDVRDGLYVFILGGFDTTSTTTQWALKYLTKYQDVQQKLRSELQLAFSGNSKPDVQELINANVPYLDAAIYEILRVGATAPFTTRNVTVDTHIMGHAIPKGTQIVCLLSGPGYQEKVISKVSDAKDPYTTNWNTDDLRVFRPERWLVESEGQLKFDPRASPMHQFGTGTRACFGKRLALLGLRIILATLVLNLEFAPIPQNLEDFDSRDVITGMPQRVYIRPVKVQK